MTDQTNDPINGLNPEEDYWAGVYADLAERYGEIAPVGCVPYMAVRLLVLRLGFERVMAALRDTKRGTAWVAAMARQEIAVRQQFVAGLIARFPGHNPEELEEAAEEMAADLAAIDCVEGGMRLLNYVERLRLRELRFAERSGTVH